MKFGSVIRALSKGSRVRRASWHNKLAYISVLPGSTYQTVMQHSWHSGVAGYSWEVELEDLTATDWELFKEPAET